MPRKRSDTVIVDPVAAAGQLGGRQPGFVQNLDIGSPGFGGLTPEKVPAAKNPSLCALGHPNSPGASFCATCGLNMSAQAPAPAAEVSRPKPASQLTPEERAERDRQHADALRAAAAFEAQQPDYVPPEGKTVLIHFIEDGLTFAGQVWYRGQEIEIGPAHPRWEQARAWILLDRFGQIERWGKQFFDRGPWRGRGYLDGINDFEKLSAGKDEQGNPVTFAGPGEEALRRAEEAERRRGRSVPAPLR